MGVNVCRKWKLQSLFEFIQVGLQVRRITLYALTTIRKFRSARDSENFWLARLEHRDWLAPNEVLKIFRNIKNPELILSSFEKLSTRMDYKPSEALYSLLIENLASARKFGVINNLLERAKSEKCRLSDDFFYRVIKIYGNVANHPEQAINTLIRMPEFHCWPTVKTFNYVLNLLICGRHYEVVHEIYLSAGKLGITPDTCCFNILIKGLCQWDKFNAAFSLLQEMAKQGCRPNKTTYSTLMNALCKHDRIDEAFELCEKMESEGCYPDTIIFNILISGLCKQGKVNEGMDFLKKMQLKGCYPDLGTYQALLYGLLNSKRFLEAKDFIAVMISEGKRPSFLSYKQAIEGLASDNMFNDVHLVLQQMVHQGFVPKMGTWRKILDCMFQKDMIVHCKENGL